MVIVTKAISLILIVIAVTGCRVAALTERTLEYREFKLTKFSEVKSSHSVEGVWIGVASYSNDQEWIGYEGSKRKVISIYSDGLGDYKSIDCNGVREEVSEDGSQVNMLGRDFMLNSYSRISGGVDFTYESVHIGSTPIVEKENWEWIKISNNPSYLGRMQLDIEKENVTEYDLNITAYCERSYLVFDKDGDDQYLIERVRMSWDGASDESNYLWLEDSYSISADGLVNEKFTGKQLIIPQLEINASSSMDTLEAESSGELSDEVFIQLRGDNINSNTGLYSLQGLISINVSI